MMRLLVVAMLAGGCGGGNYCAVTLTAPSAWASEDSCAVASFANGLLNVQHFGDRVVKLSAIPGDNTPRISYEHGDTACYEWSGRLSVTVAGADWSGDFDAECNTEPLHLVGEFGGHSRKLTE